MIERRKAQQEQTLLTSFDFFRNLSQLGNSQSQRDTLHFWNGFRCIRQPFQNAVGRSVMIGDFPIQPTMEKKSKKKRSKA